MTNSSSRSKKVKSFFTDGPGKLWRFAKDVSPSFFGKALGSVGSAALAAVSAIWIFSWQAGYQEEQTFRNNLLGRTIEILYQLESVGEELIEKYDLRCEVDNSIKTTGGFDLYRSSSISKEDRARLFSLTNELNIQFGKLFVFTSDETFQPIHDAIQTTPGTLKQFREKTLLALRKGKFSNTRFISRDDIRSLNFGKTSCNSTKATP